MSVVKCITQYMYDRAGSASLFLLQQKLVRSSYTKHTVSPAYKPYSVDELKDF